jgi:hypothetical protein
MCNKSSRREARAQDREGLSEAAARVESQSLRIENKCQRLAEKADKIKSDLGKQNCYVTAMMSYISFFNHDNRLI